MARGTNIAQMDVEKKGNMNFGAVPRKNVKVANKEINVQVEKRTGE